MTAAGVDATAAERVREHEDDLHDLAESDLPAARWARELLALLDEQTAEPGGGQR